MSETPPRRRRRPPVPPAEPRPEREDIPHMPVQEIPIEVEEAEPSAASRFLSEKKALFMAWPAPVRVVALTALVVFFFTAVLGVTHSYLVHQEERRRLEAEAAERAQHPLLYSEIIVPYDMQQGLDPALVSAVILCESSFDPMAQSRLGARGLMQLMEETAGWIAHKLNEDGAGYSFDLLYDPETNIRFGTWYLGYLSRRFNGDAKKIVCAYHAGQGNVDSWLKNPKYSADGVTLDVIPTEDTAAYAERVLRAQAVYRKYYFPVESPAVPEDG